MTLAILRATTPTGLSVQPHIAIIRLGENTAEATRQAGLASSSATAAAATLASIGIIEAAQYRYATKALATAALGSIPANEYVYVFADETRGGRLAIYRKTGGVLVLANYLPFDSPVVDAEREYGILGTGSADHAAAILQAIDDGVKILLLPEGTIGIGQAIHRLPSGFQLWGRGVDKTTIKHLAGFTVTTFPGCNTIGTVQGAVGVRVRDLTVDMSKTTPKCHGIVMWGAQGFVVENTKVKDCSGYSHWAMSADGEALKPNGLFRNVKAKNANVAFECSRADRVTWDGMLYEAGDDDQGTEAHFHALAGSTNITFRNGVSRGSGIPIFVLADTAADTLNIRFENIEGVTTSNNNAVEINLQGAAAAGHFVTVFMDNCRPRNAAADLVSGQGIVVGDVNCTLTVNGGQTDTFATGIISNGTAVFNRHKLVQVLQSGVNPNTLSVGAGGTIAYNGGELDAAGLANTTGITISPTTLVPDGMGTVIKRVLLANYTNSAFATIGTGQAQTFDFQPYPLATYRLQASGYYKSTGTTLGIALGLGGSDITSLSGEAVIQETVGAAPTRGVLTSVASYLQTPGVSAANTPLRFEFDVIIVAGASAGPFSFGATGEAASSMTILAGAVMTIEQIA